MNCLVWGARVRTCEQKKLPWIPNFRQVGHCRDAGFEQPVVEQDCSASTIADESAMTRLILFGTHQHIANTTHAQQCRPPKRTSVCKSRWVHVASIPPQSLFCARIKWLLTTCLRPPVDGQPVKVPKTSFLQHPVQQKEGVSWY